MRDVLAGRRVRGRFVQEDSAFLKLIEMMLVRGIPFAVEPNIGVWSVQYPTEYNDFVQLQIDTLGVQEGYPPEVPEG